MKECGPEPKFLTLFDIITEDSAEHTMSCRDMPVLDSFSKTLSGIAYLLSPRLVSSIWIIGIEVGLVYQVKWEFPEITRRGDPFLFFFSYFHADRS